MEDEQINDMIRRTLADSRKPPEPPLDEMWAQIEHRAFGAAPVRAIPAQWSQWATPALAAAAALLIGVGLGWNLAPRGTVITSIVTPPSQAVATAQDNGAAPSADAQDTLDSTASASVASIAIATPSQPRHPSTAEHVGPTPDVQSGLALEDVSVGQLASRYDDVGGSDMSRYLVRTAALLASLPTNRTTTASDTAIATRAGELLTQTHLLLDSKAGSDPTLHKLLEDLELVLAQVARLRVQRSGTDLQLIHQALTVRDVLPRVHDATVEASITE